MKYATTYEEFYGHEPLARVRDMDSLTSAVKQFQMAMNSGSPQIQQRALALAATNELRAYSG